ncbi:MAG TPA: host-nuclease inhibitor Gam family protein [Acidimicrobiales bacterium]
MAVIPAFLDESPPFTDDDLDGLFDWIDTTSGSPPDTEPGSKPDRWCVSDDRSAEWALRKYLAVDVAIAKLEADAEAYIAQVRAWLDRVTKPLKRRRQFFAGHLTDYALRLRYEDPTFKTLKLPSGDVPTRLVPARPEVQDTMTFVAWAAQHAPTTVKAKWSPVMAEVGKAIQFLPVLVADGADGVAGAVRNSDGHLVAIPMPAFPVSGNFHEETLPLYGGPERYSVVPGVTEVPETISASIRPAGGT